MNKADRILAAVEKAKAGYTGKLGFAFYDLSTGEECYLHKEEAFPLASVFKIYLLTALYRCVEEGSISLSDRLEVTPETMSPGSGILSRFRYSVPLSVYDHAILMMGLSDNTATDFLYRLVGRERIYSKVVQPLNLRETKVDMDCTTLINTFFGITPGITPEERTKIVYSGAFRNSDYYTCKTELNDCSSPRDLVTVLRSLYDGEIVSRESAEEIFNIMQPIPQKARIEKYLPLGTRVARKTGTLDRTNNDAGIVFTPRGDYVVVTLYNCNTADEAEYMANNSIRSEELLSMVSKAVYDVYMED